jgi:hypothetical protein
LSGFFPLPQPLSFFPKIRSLVPATLYSAYEEQAKELNSQVRDFVRKNADRLFDRLEKEEDKRANK